MNKSQELTVACQPELDLKSEIINVVDNISYATTSCDRIKSLVSELNDLFSKLPKEEQEFKSEMLILVNKHLDYFSKSLKEVTFVI